MQLDITLYRLKSSNDKIQAILDYDFADYEGSSEDDGAENKLFWRRILSAHKDRDEYRKFYENEINKIVNLMKDNDSFSFWKGNAGFDLGKYVSEYTKTQTLNSIVKTITMEFKDDYETLKDNEGKPFFIKDNDLIVIKENDKEIFIGFIAEEDSSEKYGEFKIQTATLVNLGYLYDRVKATSKKSIAGYAIAGLDTKDIQQTVYSDIFNNKNTFEIADYIFKEYFYSTEPVNAGLNKRKYLFDTDKFVNSFVSPDANNPATFATIFGLMKTFQMYIDNVVKGQSFTWADIEHGAHKTYNKLISSGFELFIPTFKTINSIFSDTIKNAMYNFYIDYDGTLHIMPPLYNYLPFEVLTLRNGSFEFKARHDCVLNSDEIESIDRKKKNDSIKTRTDARYTYAYLGEQDYGPTFYIDIKGLVKYGFLNDQPHSNPNATFPLLATLLAMITNVIENAFTRTYVVTLKADVLRATDNDRFKVGKLFYLEDENKVGYLVDINTTIKVGEFPITTLTFSYLRDVRWIKPDDYNIDDLMNIYKRYGIFENIDAEKISADGNIQISAKYFNDTYDNAKTAFKQKIHFDEGVLIPSFKTHPTILDFIQLTYTDSKVRQGAEQLRSVGQETARGDTVVKVEDSAVYRSFIVKMQPFFDVQKAGTPMDRIDTRLLGNYPKYSNYFNFKFISNESTKADPQWYQAYKQFIVSKKANSIEHAGFDYTLYDSDYNLHISQFSTKFNVSNYGYITQLLFNRIVECDAELQTLCNFSLLEYNNTIPQTVGAKVEFSPQAFKLDNDYLKVVNSANISLDKWQYNLDNNKYVLKTYTSLTGGTKLIHPQTILNMDFLQLNTILGVATVENKQATMLKVGEKNELFAAHEQGRAIDITFPLLNTNTFLYLRKDFIDYNVEDIGCFFQYKQAFRDKFEEILQKHFDNDIKKDVHRSVKFDTTRLGINIPGNTYYCDVYHLEVDSADYKDVNKELLSGAPIYGATI